MMIVLLFCFANRVFYRNNKPSNKNNKKYDYLSKSNNFSTRMNNTDLSQTGANNFEFIRMENGQYKYIKKPNQSYNGMCPFTETQEDTADNLMSFYRNLQLLFILHQLESSDKSTIEKLRIIDRIDFNENKIVPNLMSGGLLKDWNF